MTTVNIEYVRSYGKKYYMVYVSATSLAYFETLEEAQACKASFLDSTP